VTLTAARNFHRTTLVTIRIVDSSGTRVNTAQGDVSIAGALHIDGTGSRARRSDQRRRCYRRTSRGRHRHGSSLFVIRSAWRFASGDAHGSFDFGGGTLRAGDCAWRGPARVRRLVTLGLSSAPIRIEYLFAGTARARLAISI